MSTEKLSRKAQQSLDTRAALLAVARRHFTARGYAATALEEVVAEAGITRGALYHHFDSKAGLFRAVLEQAHAETAARIESEAARARSPFGQLKAGCRAFLAATQEPSIRRILLLDGPAVLGWDEWRALDEQHSARGLRACLLALLQGRELKPLPLDALAALLSGAMNEAALWIAAHSDPPAALREAQHTLDLLLDSLRRR